MNNRITQEQVTARLGENGIPYAVMPLQSGVQLVISQYGGRVLGPFLSPDAESLFWTNAAFSQREMFAAFLSSDDWNLGGERMWIAPEIQYMVTDRTDVTGTLFVPPQVDPGKYILSQDGLAWKLTQQIALEAYNLASGHKRLTIVRRLSPAPDPLRGLHRYAGLVDGVIYAGYEQAITLSEGRADEIASQVWLLIQLNPGGDLIIPCTPDVEVVHYYEPVTTDLQTVQDTHIRLKITGQRRYKMGYQSAYLTGRLGYVNQLDAQRTCLIVRCFYNNPSSIYVEQPDYLPGHLGDAVHVYNDGGELGGFGELECAGQTIGGQAGKSEITDQFLVWMYVGPPHKIAVISRILLGVAAWNS